MVAAQLALQRIELVRRTRLVDAPANRHRAARRRAARTRNPGVLKRTSAQFGPVARQPQHRWGGRIPIGSDRRVPDKVDILDGHLGSAHCQPFGRYIDQRPAGVGAADGLARPQHQFADAQRAIGREQTRLRGPRAFHRNLVCGQCDVAVVDRPRLSGANCRAIRSRSAAAHDRRGLLSMFATAVPAELGEARLSGAAVASDLESLLVAVIPGWPPFGHHAQWRRCRQLSDTVISTARQTATARDWVPCAPSPRAAAPRACHSAADLAARAIARARLRWSGVSRGPRARPRMPCPAGDFSDRQPCRHALPRPADRARPERGEQDRRYGHCEPRQFGDRISAGKRRPACRQMPTKTAQRIDVRGCRRGRGLGDPLSASVS